MSIRLSYADVDGNHTINPVTEILEVNNYYPFGLQHTGYGHIDNEHRSEEAEQYKYLDKEYENTYNLNVIETDFRQYDPALGRFSALDIMAELAYDFTPYRYGFNNPVLFSDTSGLFETVSYAMEFAKNEGFNNYRISYSAKLQGYVVTVIGGQFDGEQFYNFTALDPGITIDNSSGGGSGGENSIIKKKYNYDAFTYAMGSSVILLGDDVTGIGVADDVLIPVLWVGAAGVWLYDNNALLLKQLAEIARIIEKQLQPSGFTYELRVNRSGNYTDVRGNQIFLNAGDIWKYGETSKGSSRYSRSTLDNMVPGGVNLNAIFLGNQTEIKVQEKIMIYWYAIQNGSLPPGNKIFR